MRRSERFPRSRRRAGPLALLALGVIPVAHRAEAHEEGSAARDRAALVHLYEVTNGPDWKNSTNWLSDEPLSNWHGIATDGAGRVTELQLWSNTLTGRIPAELADLSELRELNLLGNRLTGPIPPELGELVHLWRLDLWANLLSGEIPPSLGNLPALKTLSLSSNYLTGTIPATLSKLPLRNLGLHSNGLTGPIPPGSAT